MWRKALVLGLVLMAVGMVVGGVEMTEPWQVSLWATAWGYKYATTPEAFAYQTGMMLFTFVAGLVTVSNPVTAAIWL